MTDVSSAGILNGVGVGIMEWLVSQRRSRLARELALLVAGLDIPAEVTIGGNLVLQHRAMGTVVHPDTVIGSNVTIYHDVTIGRADAHVPREASPMLRVEIGDQAILYPGARVLGGAGVARVGTGAIVGANAVLTMSTGDWEIWAGVPAKKVGTRTIPPAAEVEPGEKPG